MHILHSSARKSLPPMFVSSPCLNAARLKRLLFAGLVTSKTVSITTERVPAVQVFTHFDAIPGLSAESASPGVCMERYAHWCPFHWASRCSSRSDESHSVRQCRRRRVVLDPHRPRDLSEWQRSCLAMHPNPSSRFVINFTRVSDGNVPAVVLHTQLPCSKHRVKIVSESEKGKCQQKFLS
jgi:hypothetical protein